MEIVCTYFMLLLGNCRCSCATTLSSIIVLVACGGGHAKAELRSPFALTSSISEQMQIRVDVICMAETSNS